VERTRTVLVLEVGLRVCATNRMEPSPVPPRDIVETSGTVGEEGHDIGSFVSAVFVYSLGDAGCQDRRE